MELPLRIHGQAARGCSCFFVTFVWLISALCTIERDFFAHFKELTFSTSGPRSWTRYESFAFARPYVSVPLAWSELHRAAAHLPLCLVDTGICHRLEALLSFGAKGQSVVDQSGQWRAGYVPALLRMHPFAPDLSQRATFAPGYLENSPNLLTASGGLELWSATGAPAEDVIPVTDVMRDFHADYFRLQDAAQSLLKGKVLRPLRGYASLDDPMFDGKYILNRSALYALSAPRMLKLMQTGGLEVAFAQLISMQRLSVAPSAPAPTQTGKPEATAETFLSAMATAFDAEASEIQYDEMDRT